jgi:cytochrome c peroxidase
MGRHVVRNHGWRLRSVVICMLGVIPGLAAAQSPVAASPASIQRMPDPMTTPNPFGWLRSVAASGSIDASSAFFQSLGTNGRSCNTCHRQEDGWSITPASVRARFQATAGTDPIFRTNDGSNSPLADVSTVDKRRSAYSMLLGKGVIRVGIGIPANAEFTLDNVVDP